MTTTGRFSVRAVCFDMDGLMFNTEEIYWHVADELMRRRGFEYTPELNEAVMGCPPQPCFETMIRWYSLDERWEDLQTESEALYLGMLEKQLQPMPGLFELLDALEAAAIPKAICTSTRREVASVVLTPHAVEPRFEFTLTAEDIVHGKPDPEIYLKAAKRFGVAPEAMLVLEDSRNGCRAAVAAGTFTVAVPGPHSRAHDFDGAALVVDSLADPRLYEALGLGGPE